MAPKAHGEIRPDDSFDLRRGLYVSASNFLSWPLPAASSTEFVRFIRSVGFPERHLPGILTSSQSQCSIAVVHFLIKKKYIVAESSTNVIFSPDVPVE